MNSKACEEIKSVKREFLERKFESENLKCERDKSKEYVYLVFKILNDSIKKNCIRKFNISD